MLSYVFYLLGFSLTVFTIIDLMWTTLWVDGGAGWLTNKLTTAVWKIIKALDNRYIYNITGPLIMILTLFHWVLLLWIGVTIFFAGNPEALINTSTNEVISEWELFYYSGFTLFTLGIGDYTAQTLFFKIATALVSGLGMLLLTFGASYIISVISAVVEKRSFAGSVMGLGENSIELLKNAWNGKDFYQLDLILTDLNSKITQLTQQTQAFPLLQYYHNEDQEKASAVAIGVLDEVLTLLQYGLKDQSIINLTLVKATQSSIATYLNTVIARYGKQVKKVTDIPPPLDLTALKELNIPLVSQKKYSENIKKIEKRRNQISTIITIDHHKWPNT